MKKYPVVGYTIKLVKGKLIDFLETTKLIGFVRAKSREKAINKLGLIEHKLFDRIHYLHCEADEEWPEIRDNCIAHGCVYGYYIFGRKMKKVVKKLTARMIKPFPSEDAPTSRQQNWLKPLSEFLRSHTASR